MENPHDMLFRAVFADPTHAGPLLGRAVPAALSRFVDWSTLAAARAEMTAGGILGGPEPTNLLFTVKWRCAAEPFFVLLQRRAGPDPLAVLDVLQVVLRITEPAVELRPDADGPPFVLPVVVHHGDRPFAFVLLDLAKFSEEDLLRWGGSAGPAG